ncbi:CitMHS family citrate-Mg2+:H+ or citrate-Ca2+:H+ symporter [Pseudoclavibacter sp. JAI123]|uniref:CitMHS family transporter n=1 Tax=Pseudoclavibacter sp. JAI123 TaxID=2723065 RepID=UPI0018151B88|nr:citrate:proton symporter [Pseudoclavibacter sp. JAI123]NYF12513.1 CitMHS family citrate-Mg2+:H+ or citrate-Ca2+:H+ symporter [Pseudoclavibacter sp. JAI123]
MLTLFAWLTILVFMALIMMKKIHPFVGLALIPIIFTVLGSFFGLFTEAVAAYWEKPVSEVTLLEQFQAFGEWAADGMVTTSSTAYMLFFAILFFSVMLAVGLFDPLTRQILKIAKGDPLKILVGTGIISAVVSLSGDGTTTTLIVCSALIPIYRKLGLRLMDLAVILILMNTILNLLPWSGPTARVLAVLPEISANEILQSLVPGMLASVAFVMLVCVYRGLRERKRLGVSDLSIAEIDELMQSRQADGNVMTVTRSKPVMVFNAVLTLLALAVLMAGLFEPVFIFMAGTLIAFAVNFPKIPELKKFIDSTAPDVLQTVIMVIGAGVFMGLFTNSGMSSAIAQSMVNAFPASFGPSWPFITTLVSAPGGFFISNDAFFYGVLPVLAEAGQAYGFTQFEMGYASLMGQAFHMLSPLTAFIYLLLNLTKQDMGEWQREAGKWAAGIFVILIAVALLTGHLPAPVLPLGAWQFWLVLAAIAGAAIGIFMLVERSRKRKKAVAEEKEAELVQVGEAS